MRFDLVGDGRSSRALRCAAGLALTLLSFGAAAATKPGPGAQFPTAADFPGQEAVFLSRIDEVETEIYLGTSIKVVEYVAVSKKVFSNVREHDSVDILLSPNEEITSISARTILPSGESVDVRTKDIFTSDVEATGGIIAIDVKKVRFTFPSVQPGSILEYNYRKSRPGIYGADVWDFQQEIPVLKTSYTIIVPSRLMSPGSDMWMPMTWRYKQYNTRDVIKPETMHMPKLRRDSFGDRVGYRWTAENVPAFTPEPHMAPVFYYRGYVRFSPAEWQKWNDFSSWYLKGFLAPRLKPQDAVTAKSLELTKAASDEDAKVRALFDYVKALKYSSVALGVGKIQPRPPEEVLLSGWGDCKDKSTLLIGLLRASGISADPVLVRTADEGRIDADFPTFVFNHMIVRAKTSAGGVLWLDPTVSVAAAGSLPPADEGIDVLVMAKDGSSTLEKTPIRTYQQNLTAANVAARVDGEAVKYSVSVRFHGAAAIEARHRVGDATGDHLTRFCQGLLAPRFRETPIENASATPLEKHDAPLTVAFEIRSSGGLQPQGDLVLLDGSPLDLLPPLPSADVVSRKYPLAYRFPRTIQQTVRVAWQGSGMTLRNAPTPASMSADALSYRLQPNPTGAETLEIDEKFIAGDRFVLVDSWPKLQEFLKGLTARRSEKIILAKKSG
jgi:hypothetical protein